MSAALSRAAFLRSGPASRPFGFKGDGSDRGDCPNIGLIWLLTSYRTLRSTGSCCGFHLFLIMRPHHTQFREPGRTESNTVGTPLWAGYALRSAGLFFLVAGVLVALGGLVQINPIWQWGPYESYLGTNGAQPDWYLGWLIGALRLVPSFDVTIGDYTLVRTRSGEVSCFRRLYSGSCISGRWRNGGSRKTRGFTTSSTGHATSRSGRPPARRFSSGLQLTSMPALLTVPSCNSASRTRPRSGSTEEL